MRLTTQLLHGALLLFCFAWALVPLGRGDDASDALRSIRQDLFGPVRLELSNGTVYIGRIVSYEDGLMNLAVSQARGEATLAFEKAQIASLRFSGRQHLGTLADWMEDPERTSDALRLFRLYYSQQYRYLDLLDRSSLNLFLQFVQFAVRHNEALLAIDVAEELMPFVQTEAEQKTLSDTIMMGLFKGGMAAEALERARDWIASADPAGDTALGWRIVAEIKLGEGEYEDALWAALNPVAFSAATPMEELDVCYAIAVVAAEALREHSVVQSLLREMRSRGIAWPTAHELVGHQMPEVAEPNAAGEEAEARSAAADIMEAETKPQPSPIDPLESLPTRILF